LHWISIKLTDREIFALLQHILQAATVVEDGFRQKGKLAQFPDRNCRQRCHPLANPRIQAALKSNKGFPDLRYSAKLLARIIHVAVFQLQQ